MSIGYACLTIGVQNTDLKSCMIKNASNSKLTELIAHNLNSLENMIDYNIKNNIKLFRISSDLIPFGSNKINNIHWWEIFAGEFQNIGKKIIESNMRVSMHPGQYTVLNSPNTEVSAKAIDDLNYHARVLDSLGVGSEHKIILHIGGIYNDKNLSAERFIFNYSKLDEKVIRRLVIENDDKSFNIQDVLDIGTALSIPVIFDNLHNEINSFDKNKSEIYWIDKCKSTWHEKDGKQKIHYSQQNPLKKSGSHSETIRINEFMNFYDSLRTKDIDIMLEVKDKNLSTIKCINCISPDKRVSTLETEWSKYKYSVLEKSQSDYLEIRKLFRNKNDYPALEFYNILENAMQKPTDIGNSINAAQHVWGYFKNIATEKEKNDFIKSINNYEQNKTTIIAVKNKLKKMAVKYEQIYLLNSYYFLY